LAVKFQVVLHEGVVDRSLRVPLAEAMRRAYASAFGVDAAALSVDFAEVRRGRFFTAGRPSRSALVGVSVPRGTSPADRARLMSAITAIWCETAGLTPDDVVVSASDSTT